MSGDYEMVGLRFGHPGSDRAYANLGK